MENKTTKKPTHVVHSEEGIVIPEIANKADLSKAIDRWPIASSIVWAPSPYNDDGDCFQCFPRGFDVKSILATNKLRPEERAFWGAVLQNQIDSWKK